MPARVRQLNLFYLALSFFTRLPVPSNTEFTEQLLNRASRYFSLVGLLLALILTIFFIVANGVVSTDIALLLMMSISLLLTGAFHEDGLADMADGIGGGFTRAQRLAIMKDSRLGSYGAVSLLMILALKFALLRELFHFVPSMVLVEYGTWVLIVLLCGYGLSRAVAGSLIFEMKYVTDTQNSKCKPLAEQQTVTDLLLLMTIGCAPLLLLPLFSVLVCFAVLVVFRFLFKAWLVKRLGGFTGDCLGAAQQVAEILIYLALLIGMTSRIGVLR